MTIRKRLTLWYAALLTIIIILFGTITFSVMRFTMLNNIDTTLKETGSLIARNSQLRQIPGFGAPTPIQIELPSLDQFRAANIYVQAWQVNPDGEMLLAGASANLRDVTEPLDVVALGYDGTSDTIGNTVLRGRNLRVLTKAIPLGDRLVGNLQVAVDLETVNQATDLLLLVMLVSCAIAIFGAGALSMWFSDRALQPINSIADAAASIANTDDLGTRLRWNGPADELGRMVSVFNQMMNRIEHLFSVQQRFVADVSHELRTPLTAIQGNVEMVKRYGMDEESLEAIESESKRMSRLVNDLLMLARADYGGMTVDLYPIDLDTVIMDAFQTSKALTQDRDLEVKIGKFEPLRVNGNPDRLQQVVSNLVSNAIKFTDDGGNITLSLEKSGDYALISVADTGVGIGEEDINRVFDRFYQSDPARTHTGGGFGLGLSIAKWIVEAHHGTIAVSSQPGEGATFMIKLPMLPEHHHHQEDLHHSHTQPTRTRIPIIRWPRPGEQHEDPNQ